MFSMHLLFLGFLASPPSLRHPSSPKKECDFSRSGSHASCILDLQQCAPSRSFFQNPVPMCLEEQKLSGPVCTGGYASLHPSTQKGKAPNERYGATEPISTPTTCWPPGLCGDTDSGGSCRGSHFFFGVCVAKLSLTPDILLLSQLHAKSHLHLSKNGQMRKL